MNKEQEALQLLDSALAVAVIPGSTRQDHVRIQAATKLLADYISAHSAPANNVVDFPVQPSA